SGSVVLTAANLACGSGRPDGPAVRVGAPPLHETEPAVTTVSLSSADPAGIATLSTDAVVVATAPAGRRKKSAVVVGPAGRLRAAAARKLQESLDALGATGKAG